MFAVGVNYKQDFENSIVIGWPSRKSIEDRNKWMYNRGVKENDAIHGVWNDRNYPYWGKRDEHVKKSLFFYKWAYFRKWITKIWFKLRYIGIMEKVKKGENILKYNIVMLNHELTELIMRQQGMSYREAHNQTDKIYNYLEELEKWQRKRGDLDVFDIEKNRKHC